MGLWRDIRNRLANRIGDQRKLVPGIEGRISVDEGNPYAMVFDKFASNLSGLAAKFPFQFYEVMDWLFLREPYFARYLQQTINLGNTGHKLEIFASTEKQAADAIAVTNDLAARCFPFGGGADGLISGMLSQVARAGATCCEWPGNKGLTQVDCGYLIPIKTCRFRRKPDLTLEVCQVQLGLLVPLNPVQTTFTAAAMWDDNPNPIPPTISAMRALIKLNKFDDSIDGWLNKLSGLGLLVAQIQTPERDYTINESDDAYEKRTRGYLANFIKAVSAHLKGGLAAAFDNVTFKHHNTSAGAQGAKEILQMVLQALFAGLGVDPVFMGWNFNSTETFAKVVFEDLIGRISTYQLAAKRSMEHGYRLNLALSGLGDVGVSLRFNPNRSIDAFLGAESWQMEAQAAKTLLEAGLADRDELRKKLGFENEPAQSNAFIASFNRVDNCYRLAPFKRSQWPGMGKRPLDLSVGAGFALPEKGAASGAPTQEAESRIAFVQNSAKDARNAARTYVFQVRNQLSAAAQVGVDAVYEWARVRDIPEADVFVREALERFRTGAEGSLDAATLESIAKEHLSKIWKWARHEDASVFGREWDRQSRGAGVTFGMQDDTAINYLKRVDRFYASGFISNDEAVSRRVTDFLREQYMEKGLARDKSQLPAFREQFGDFADQISDHRARVIIDTGVSRCQNWGEILALHDEAFKVFRIAGPWDSTTCEWCYALQGKEFKVAVEASRIENIISSGNEEIGKFDQFITSRFSGSAGLERLNSLDGDGVQATGMVSAPIHPLCRHRTIAVIEVSGSNIRVRYVRVPILVGSYEYADAA